ncbi:hypothetical protein LUZ61_008127 [Rhynchospora tenuis]|uniref:3'-5' exonuclease domain-containing protein n=1 Tax=Rhynchospora tenuis TaxID=198213 RepID=A0AAD5ZUZ5_9POAL|nr:hypothetical protein LUZ61_008127 [Rhynchospora tenuis]
MDNSPNTMPSNASHLNQISKSGPSGLRGKFHKGRFKKRKRNKKTIPLELCTPNSTASTTTCTRAITDSTTPFKTTQSKILFGPHEIDATVTTDPLIANQWIDDTRAAHHTTNGKKIVVGLDCEWKPNRHPRQNNKIALLQLCTGSRCLILQLKYMNPVPDSVKAFLLDETITFVGVGVGEDVAKLKGNYGLECTNSRDLRPVCNTFLGIETKKCKGLKGYAREILGFELEKSKSATMSNWEEWNLKESQIRYACLDAFVSYLLGCKVLEENSD